MYMRKSFSDRFAKNQHQSNGIHLFFKLKALDIDHKCNYNYCVGIAKHTLDDAKQIALLFGVVNVF